VTPAECVPCADVAMVAALAGLAITLPILGLHAILMWRITRPRR
jgi:hypothetical protein